MGEKQRVKSKGKTAKSTKQGLRPHELRQQQDTSRGATGQPSPAGAGEAKKPRP